MQFTDFIFLVFGAGCFISAASSTLDSSTPVTFKDSNSTFASKNDSISEVDTAAAALDPGKFWTPTASPPDEEEVHDERHGLEPCSVLSEIVPESISTHLPQPATRPPQSCKDYEISREFIPSTNVSADQLFKAGFDIDREKLYICKAFINGVEFLGRGTISQEIKKCWLDLGTHEVLVGDKFSVLRKPQGVRLLWRNGGGIERGLNPMGNGKGNERWVGRTIFQSPVHNQQFPICMTKSEDGEVLIPGFVEASNPSRLRFSFGSNMYTSQNFMLLTCAELK